MSNHKQSCISFTAPQFTAEDQQREQESLTDADRTAIQEKLLGWMALRRETPQFLEKGVQQLEHALSEIPMTQKEAYQRALERAPEVVQDETNPVAFLRAEDYQPEVSREMLGLVIGCVDTYRRFYLTPKRRNSSGGCPAHGQVLEYPLHYLRRRGLSSLDRGGLFGRGK
jgi:hypothetical protein